MLIWKARFSGRARYLFSRNSSKFIRLLLNYLENYLIFQDLITLEGCGGFFPFIYFFFIYSRLTIQIRYCLLNEKLHINCIFFDLTQRLCSARRVCIFNDVLPELAERFTIYFKWERLFVVLCVNAFLVSLYHPEDEYSRSENCKETSGNCMFFVTEKNAFSYGF